MNKTKVAIDSAVIGTGLILGGLTGIAISVVMVRVAMKVSDWSVL